MLLRNENIICISSIDWDFVWQGHQEIMSGFAGNGNRVLFIENTGIRTPKFQDIPRLKKRIINWARSTKGFRKVIPSLYVYSPVIMPFPYSKLMRLVNRYLLIRPLRRWIKAMDFSSPIIWTFLPTGTVVDIINSFDKKLFIYYCIADFYELNPRAKKKIQETEDEIIRRCDLIFAQGEVLANKCRRFNNNVHIFPFGVNIKVFDKFRCANDSALEDTKGINKPIIGYIGGIHRHIDVELLCFIARQHPEWSIVLIGPIQTGISRLRDFANIFLLGQKDFTSLPGYIKEFAVGIIPYQINEYTETVFPTKLNEYHAMGKLVVSTDLPEIRRFNAQNNNLVLIGSTCGEFADAIVKALKTSDSESTRQRIEAAARNSWDMRMERMNCLMMEAIERKNSGPPQWQELFLGVYRRLRRRTTGIIAFLLCGYLLLFYTPFIWIVAQPLVVSHIPEKADCIIVFAGGVGESGKAGQGYEERVKFAADLYKKGYAEKVIFSSGYTYALKETFVMKALAVSLGVREQAILLEEKAGNTYQNVIFTKEILAREKIDKVLLVSSPYHMRRALLVFKKVAGETQFLCVPLPESIFYAHGAVNINGRRTWRQANIQQIKGILHEYLGILYYWWKGYI